MKIKKSLLAASVLAAVAAASAGGAFGEEFAEKRVTCSDDRNHFNPRWSIDRSPRCDIRGDRLAFEVRETNPEGKAILRLYMTTKVGKDTEPGCPVGFSDPVPLSDERTNTTRAQWSPVSGDVLVAQKKILGYWQIVKIVVGGGEQILTTGSYHHVNPQWSQDGKFIVFERKERGSPTRIGVICANGCNEIAADTPADGSDRRFPSFHWNTTGIDPEAPYSVVYEVATGAVTDVASFRFDDLESGAAAGTESRVTNDGEADRFPQYVDDFYLWQRFDLAVARWQVADRGAALDAPVRILTADLESGAAEADHISPRVALNNNLKVIYVKDELPDEFGEGGGPTLYRLIRPEFENDRPIERRVVGPGASTPQWSPNGDNIVFQKKVDARWQIFILDSVR